MISIISFFPTMGWAVFYLVPMLVQWVCFNGQIGEAQAFLGLLYLTAFFLSDFLSYKWLADRNKYVEPSDFILKCLAVLVVLPPAIHLMMMEDIPILDLLFGNITGSELSLARENSSKLLGLPSWFIYLCNWSVNVFAPAYVTFCIVKKRYFSILLPLFFMIFYCISTTAKMPIVFFSLMVIFIVFIYYFPRNITKKTVIFIFVLSLLLSLTSTYLRIDDVKSSIITSDATLQIEERNKLAAGIQGISVGDYLRFDDTEYSGIQRIYNHIVYRLLLTPSDVSSRWYQYCSDSDKSLFPYESGLSNEIGKWAYYSRFPEHYLPSVSAYASMDADAYCRGGIGLTITLLALLVFMRVVMTAFVMIGTNSVLAVPYGIMMMFLLLLPTAASFQAIFVAQGVLAIFLLTIVLRYEASK